MEPFEQALLGVLALVILFLFWPGVKSTLQKSREAEHRDWPAVIVPVCIVVLFVLFLIMVARN